MAAFTGSPTSSVQHAAQQRGGGNVEARDSAVLRFMFFNYTHTAGAGTGEVNLCTLPAGRIRIFGDYSRVRSSAMVATADLHIGHRAYTDEAGTAVAEDDNEWADNLDAGAAIDVALGDGGTTLSQYESRDGITVYAMVDTANIEDTDTIDGWIAYTHV